MNPQDQDAIIKASHTYVKSFHNDYNDEDGNKLARLYFNSVDKDGFCIDFDEVWELVGYSKKSKGKARLISEKSKLKPDVDYKILLNQQEGV